MSRSQNNKEQQTLYSLNEDSISFYDLLHILAKHVQLIILVTIIITSIAFIYAFFIAKPVFISSSKIMSSSSNNSSSSEAMGIAAQFGFNLGSSQPGPKWVYPEIIKSRTIARKLLKKSFKTDLVGSKSTLLDIISIQYLKSDLSKSVLESKAVNKLHSMIRVSENIKTGIISIYVSAFEAKLASEINHALIQELDTHQKDYNKAKTSKAKKFIEQRMHSTEKELILSEERLKTFRDRNRRIENSPALQLEQQRLTREVTVLTGVFTTLKQQLETTKIEEVKDSDYVITLDSPEIPLQRSKPKRKNIVLYGFIVGLVSSIIISFIHNFFLFEREKEKKQINATKEIFLKNIQGLKKVFQFRKY